MNITFTVPGDPAPKERPRFGRGRTYTPRKTELAEHQIVDAFDLAYPLEEPVTGPVGMRIVFYRATKRRVDLDNLAKTVLDALNRVAYSDDHLHPTTRTHQRRRPGQPKNRNHDLGARMNDGQHVIGLAALIAIPVLCPLIILLDGWWNRGR